MPSVQLIQNAELLGYVSSIPIKTANKTQFQFQVVQFDKHPAKTTILLSCYQQCPDFHAGDAWTIHAKLLRPKNLANPGGFDYVTSLSAKHVFWTGFLIKNSSHYLYSKVGRFYLLIIREKLGHLLENIDQNEKSLGVLQALTLGISTHLDQSMWDLFRNTGTTHLMVISGAHIGLIAGLTYQLISWCWCRLPKLCLRWPAMQLASIVAFLMASIYCLLAGFGVPAQRALIVCFFMFLPNFTSQRIGVWQSWRYALFIVLIMEPHSVTMPGFYLSFIAVAILVSVNQRFSLSGFRNTMVMQLSCLGGLMPLTFFWFSYGSINGLLANILAIPWVSFIIVPLGLLVTIMANWLVLPWMVSLLTKAIDYLLIYLHWVDHFSFLNPIMSLNHILSPLAMMMALMTLIFLPQPRLVPVTLILLMASLFPGRDRVEEGDVRVDVLDVAQGLAVVVNTAHHSLVYDTGIKFFHGGDMGKLVLIPYLKTLGIKQLDKVIISHPDLDHRGGLASLENKYHIKQLVVDDPAFYKRGLSCHHYPDWNWDGVSFHFFPIVSNLKSKNNSSCVLKISNSTGSILLTGDIERPAEEYLVHAYGKRLASSVMVIPHHGSKTSSTRDFINQVSPRYALVSYGFNNRYHFPHQQAMNVYQQRKILVTNTVDCGMISVLLKRNSVLAKPECYLKQN